MQQDEHEEESAEEEPQEEPAEEPAEELAEAAVSAELKDPASMTPYGCPPGLPKMLGIVRLGQMARVPHGPSIFPAQDPEHSARRRIREVLHAPLCSWASFGKMSRRVRVSWITL